MLKDILGKTDTADLIAFRDALTRYIDARLHNDAAAGNLDVMRNKLAMLETALAEQKSLTESLHRQLVGGTSSVDVVSQASIRPERNGHLRRQQVDDLRNRKYMCNLLDISKATLTRWVRTFDAYLSGDCKNEPYIFTAADEAMLLRVKELRQKGYDMTAILAILAGEQSDDNADRIN